ncbi:replicative DNA helicase [Corynebacterium sp. TAE3-ERU12]|uniref:replicative DNA helicase n=1 Tax=Corynebacterium sp. TAE3-ERU12 TaxID=2849491 RepID=UPI001C44B8F9|nr:replicative DNA helicase [Corynebacterium sp. TAE3-ERU12]MBV7294315.1 replicative DNA helicase [Corynebacterium sp. TAE3-ERU12]
MTSPGSSRPFDGPDYTGSNYADVPPPPEDSGYPHDDYSSAPRPGAGGSTNFDRRPPHNIEAEQAVLGGMLLSDSVVADVYSLVKAEDFYRPAHQAIYNAIIATYGDSAQTDPLLVANRLEKSGDLERIGGAPYLHTLTAMVPTAANAHYYARIVAEKSLIRRLVDAGTRIVQMGYAGQEDTEAEKLVDAAQQELFDLTGAEQADDYARMEDLLEPTMLELRSIEQDGGLAHGVPTGFVDLDNVTNGLHPGQMIIIAARPGVGKSTLAIDFMRAASIHHGKTSVIFSLEMSKSEIMMRILSAEAKVKLANMRAGRMTETEWSRLVEGLGKWSEANLFIDDSPNLTMMEIRSKARQLKREHDLDLIVVDYLQLMSSGKKVESRQQEVAEFSRNLKLMAKELEVPVIAISQLNRGPETRTDKRPQIADLRESGSLEQDADIVLLLYRPSSQPGEDESESPDADIIIAKHRGGPLTTVRVVAQLNMSRFVSASPDP